MKKNQDLEAYKRALWEYLLEHSDITKSGSLFVKFHVTTKSRFEGHVNARVNGYHRGDPKEKEALVAKIGQEHKQKKILKKVMWKEEKKKRQAIMDFVKFQNSIRSYPLPARFFMKIFYQLKHR